jgi:hypothetical protein
VVNPDPSFLIAGKRPFGEDGENTRGSPAVKGNRS